MCIRDSLWACHYGLLGAYTAVLTNGVGLFRAVLCYHNDKPWAKSRGWVALLLGLYAGCALLTWDGLYCLLPCLSMACTCLLYTSKPWLSRPRWW